jgi:1-deoxy-D-xylulose-5-phosphate reductoisomerase
VFRAFRAGTRAARAGGTGPAVFNAANEVAVAGFLEGRIAFGGIADTIERVLDEHVIEPVSDLESLTSADRWARRRATEVLS